MPVRTRMTVRAWPFKVLASVLCFCSVFDFYLGDCWASSFRRDQLLVSCHQRDGVRPPPPWGGNETWRTVHLSSQEKAAENILGALVACAGGGESVLLPSWSRKKKKAAGPGPGAEQMGRTGTVFHHVSGVSHEGAWHLASGKMTSVLSV